MSADRWYVREITSSSKTTYERNLQNFNIFWKLILSNNNDRDATADNPKVAGEELHVCSYIKIPLLLIVLSQQSI